MKIRKLISSIMIISFLLVGFVAVQNADALPLKKDWQKTKKQYKVKSGLAKVKMGKAFDKYQKVAKKKDPKAILKALKKLEGQLGGYTATAKKKKADKAFIAYCEKTLKEIGQLQTIYEGKINPLKIVKMRLAKARTAAKKLKSNSPKDDFSSFYREEYRLIGMALKDLVKKEPDFKSLAKRFNKDASKVNKALNSGGDLDTKKLRKTINSSLKSLNAAVKRL